MFTGIGEFSIHKEFVSAKISGNVASLRDPALDRIFNQEKYLRVYYQYRPLWELLSKDAVEKVRKGNYERIFDQARVRVRAWEKVHGGESR